jgi:hypothetical protein
MLFTVSYMSTYQKLVGGDLDAPRRRGVDAACSLHEGSRALRGEAMVTSTPTRRRGDDGRR